MRNRLICSIFQFLLLFVLGFYVVAAQSPEYRHMTPADATPATIADAADAMALMASLPPGPGGRLNVRVNVDENGKVIAAEVVHGPGNVCPSVNTPEVRLIREAGAKAAGVVRFTPAKMGDVSVESVGWIYFDTKSTPSDVFTVKGERNYMAANPPGKTEPISDPNDNGKDVSGKSLSGGVLTGKAMELPKPSYPPAARAVRAEGLVGIQVLIAEDGTVFSAEAVNGHPLLRSSARLAACSAKFHPTLLDGKPVKVAGIINYNFVP